MLIIRRQTNVSSSWPRRVIFHLGLPKTGSTSVQALLRENASLLSPDVGVWPRGRDTKRMRRSTMAYVRSGTPRALVASCVQIFHFGRFLRSYDAPVAIVSDENILGMVSTKLFDARAQRRSRHVAFLLKYLIGFGDQRYVIYRRNHDDWLRSAYSEAVKRKGLDLTFEQWAHEYSGFRNPDHFLASLSSCLRNRLSLVDMESEAASGYPLGWKLLELADVHDSVYGNLVVPSPRNRRLDPHTLERLRQQNRAAFL